ncbi:MAG: DUF1330 domain-containing protein [Myxococcota bacterium]
MVLMYVTVVPNPEHMDDLAAYSEASGALLKGAGGEVITRARVTGSIHGNPAAPMFMVMRFSSEERIRAVFESDAYKTLIPRRERAFQALSISLVEEF